MLSCPTVYDDVTRRLVPIESVDEILQCDHLVTFPVVLFHGTKCFVLFVCLFVFFDLMFDMSGVGEQNGSHIFFFSHCQQLNQHLPLSRIIYCCVSLPRILVATQ